MNLNDFTIYRYPAWIHWCNNLTVFALGYTFVTCALTDIITNWHAAVFLVGAFEILILIISRAKFRIAAMADAASKNLDLTKVRFL